ncbi:alpha/beta fold hydrolase [Variovorax saccharolyticus]|uniref:alpha/beta fold hydrolase n=1 Tax=Variovorax saccharolyticus TaxID=3053516 RepID=UPI0025759525|nr:alpha/beta hydrolase [Variovorax sp. J31P216]MDM0026075.1 alpha/beta hydrolase [Variovorax sp. J31P216]
MTYPTPNVRESGTGPGVVCVHSNASTSSQWRALMDRLSPDFHVFAPDSFGAGQSPAWPRDRVVTLSDEAALLEPVFEAAGSPFSLVGHSYGGAVALMVALARPSRVRAIAVYEPTLFALLDEEHPGHVAASGIRSAVADAVRALEAHDPAAAAQVFIDYWMGPGTWSRIPAARQAPIAASMVNVAGWAHALFSEPTPLRAFRALKVPVLYMVGGKSPASSRGVARLLTSALPHVKVLEFGELGHMGPVTHPELVNDAVADFLSHNAWVRG